MIWIESYIYNNYDYLESLLYKERSLWTDLRRNRDGSIDVCFHNDYKPYNVLLIGYTDLNDDQTEFSFMFTNIKNQYLSLIDLFSLVDMKCHVLD